MGERRRRRATGPAGAYVVADEPRAPVVDDEHAPGGEVNDDERFLADRPPHHDREQ